MQEKIIILDFGSQYTQLIARRLQELNTRIAKSCRTINSLTEKRELKE